MAVSCAGPSRGARGGARGADVLGMLLAAERAAQAPHVERQDVERDELAGERLRRRDADLGPGVRVEVPWASRVAIDPTTLQIARSSRRACAPRAGPRACRRVSPDCVTTTWSVWRPRSAGDSVLGAVVDLGRDAREVLEEELPGERGVPRGPAGDQADTLDGRERVVGQAGIGRARRCALERQLRSGSRAPRSAARGSPSA